MPRIPAKQLGGLTLAVDAKKIDKFLVLDGRNFLLDAEGPRSAFGYTQTQNLLLNSQFVHSETSGDTTFYFAHDEDSNVCHVFTADWQNRQFLHVFAIPEISTTVSRKFFPWTTALVGGVHYMCHLAFGIWQYDAVPDAWVDVTSNIKTDLGGIADVFYVTEAAGRMAIMATGLTAWSAIDDGTDFVLSTSTGSGAQSLALIGTPTVDAEYKGIFKVSDGYLTVTQFGVMKSTIIDSINPFRHDQISNEHIPLTPNCVVRISTATLVFLTETGLYSTDGRGFQVWQPLMSEYLKLREIPTLSRTQIGQVQLHYDFARQWFMLSLSANRSADFFTHAYALYLPRNEWGRFDTVHRNFVDVDEFGDNSKISLAFIALTGKLALFTDTTDNILLESQGDTLNSSTLQNEVYYAETHLQKPLAEINGVTIASSTAFGSSAEVAHKHQEAFVLSPSQSAGWYEMYGDLGELQTTPSIISQDNEDTILETALSATVSTTAVYAQTGIIERGFNLQLAMQDSLNASIDVGLFRLTNELESQQMTQVYEVALSMESSLGSAAASVDWLTNFSTDVIVDWAALPELVVDWGFAVLPDSNYTQFIMGTLDGYAQFEDQLHTLEVVQLKGKTKFCSTDTTGLYLQVKVEASEIGQSFHLKDLELTGNLAGRL